MIRLNQYQVDEERRKITNWLSPTNFSALQTDLIKRHQEGTGQWLLDSEEFEKWIAEPGQTLFCPGIPGAGKTMMTAITVESLRSRFETDRDVSIAFLYCNYKRYEEQRFEDLMASLLYQMKSKACINATFIENHDHLLLSSWK